HIAGFVGLWMVFAAVFLVILFLPGATTGQKYPSFDLASILALAAAILLIHPRLEQRPELVGVLFQVLLMVLLRASSLEKITVRLVLGLPLLFVAWSNVHSTFLFGFFTLGLWITNEWWRLFKTVPTLVLLRRGALLALLALISSALTPYGPERLLFPFMQASDPGSTALSPEMWPITAYSSVVLGLLLFGVALLAWGILTTPGLPLWLIAFSVFSVAISVKSVRFTDFTAVALLFVYAQRDGQTRTWSLPRLLAIPLDLLLCLLILFTLFMDVFSVLASYNELRAESRLATHALRYASDMAAYPAPSQERRVPVLCGLGAGSYLSFPGHGNYRPLLDSGLSHFDSDTKRYFFFAWLEPEALALALDELHVDEVILDPDTFSWIPTLRRQNNWQFVTCSANGMIWKRAPAGPHPLSVDEQAQVRAAIAKLRQSGNALAAFDYSTLVDRPADSLALLAEDHMTVWKETFFNSLRAWLDGQSPSESQGFLAGHSCEQCPLLGATLAARLGPAAYDHFLATHPNAPGMWYGKALTVEMLLRKGDTAQARKVFASISPVPASSTTYYRLWHAVHAQDQPMPELGPYGQWQSWDASGKIFLEEMSVRLNDRLALLERTSSR
ncbi:MAG TPA: hypothetical protein VHY09_08395, partial [Candidatus Methylacidiphilales bacterium]|nr:hypothetical protein [Candidatus Methylacidiphilales bacterium]